MGNIIAMLNAKTGLWDNLSTPDFVLGARDPTSRPGYWEGAFVGGSQNGKLYSALFVDHMDFIGHPTSLQQVLNEFARYLGLVWKKMSPQDIKKTSGMRMCIEEDDKDEPAEQDHDNVKAQ